MQLGRIPVTIVVLWTPCTAGTFLIYSFFGSPYLLQLSNLPNLNYPVGGDLDHLFSLKLDLFTPFIRIHGTIL